MTDPKHDSLQDKAEQLRRRFNYDPSPPNMDDSRKTPAPPPNMPEKKASAFLSAVLEMFKEAGMPPPLPAAAKLVSAVKKPNPMADALFSGMKAAPKSNVLSSLAKTGQDLTAAQRADLPKKDFAVPAKKSNTGKPAYPIPDEQHARSALGFAKMHGDDADYARVRAKVEQKYPSLLKAGGALQLAGTKLPPAGLLQRLGKGLASGGGEHAAELAGLGILAVPSLDEMQAHIRAGVAGDYNKDGVKARAVLPHVAHPLMETAGLGVLAAPSIAHLRGH